MPLSAIQEDVLRLIAANRSPDSYVAGATVLHRGADTPRYSADLDLFHDLEDSIARSAETDAETLGAAGYELSWLLRTPTFGSGTACTPPMPRPTRCWPWRRYSSTSSKSRHCRNSARRVRRKTTRTSL